MPTLTGSYTETEHSNYTEYTVDSNSKLRVMLGEGDEFANALIDVTASGAGVQIYTWPDPNDLSSAPDTCAIRNVGISGQVPKDNGYVFSTGVRDEAVIEHVYLGDGEPGTSPHEGRGGFFGFENHTGMMDLKQIYVAGFSDNGFYMPGRPGNRGGWMDGSGTYHWEDCYVANCQIAAYRVNDQPGTHSMLNCHADVSGNASRAVWNWDSMMQIKDCQLQGGSNGGVIGDGHSVFSGDVDIGGSVTTSYEGSYGTSPSPSPPDACPTTALEAATGDASSSPSEPTDPGETLDHTLLVSGEQRSDSGAAEYTLRTTGTIEAGEYRDPNFSSSDIVREDTYYEVTWTVVDWRDSWEFAGDLFYLECDDDDVVFELDGQQIDPTADEYSQDPPDPEEREPPSTRPDVEPDFSETVSVAAGETETVTFDVPTE